MAYLRLTSLFLIGVAIPVCATAQQADFNPYILKAVETLKARYAGGGYDISKAFTHDIDYGGVAIRKSASTAPPAPTMCVAGVAEVIMTAIALYAHDVGDTKVFDKVPAGLWQKGNLLSLKANIFMFAGTGSRGTAHTLGRFGLGRELPFDKLKPGDFVNLNRTSKSGHAVVFMGYLDGSGTVLPAFAPTVKGFRYFSAQGRGKPDAGFAYRSGFFSGTCPTLGGGMVRDCNIIRSANPVLLNTGRMDAPGAWRVAEAIAKLKTIQTKAIGDASPGISRAAISEELDRELPEQIDPRLDGSEDDGGPQ